MIREIRELPAFIDELHSRSNTIFVAHTLYITPISSTPLGHIFFGDYWNHTIICIGVPWMQPPKHYLNVIHTLPNNISLNAFWLCRSICFFPLVLFSLVSYFLSQLCPTSLFPSLFFSECFHFGSCWLRPSCHHGWILGGSVQMQQPIKSIDQPLWG